MYYAHTHTYTHTKPKTLKPFHAFEIKTNFDFDCREILYQSWESGSVRKLSSKLSRQDLRSPAVM